MKRILVVDDDRQITRMLRTSLQSSGYGVLVAANGLEAFERFEAERPDMIITDLAMPEMNGLELTEAVRRVSTTPILVLSVRNTDAMKIGALDAGADDYLTKPFSMPELLARVRVQLRRAEDGEPAAQHLVLGDFEIDTDSHSVTVRGRSVHLSPKEFDLLLLLACNSHRVMTHKAILGSVWGPAGLDQPEYLRVLIGQLRRKLDGPGQPKYIVSEPWVGYRFQPEGKGDLDAAP